MSILVLFAALQLSSPAEARIRARAPECKDAGQSVTVSADDQKKLAIMSVVLTEATLCANKEAKGCSVSTIVEGGAVARLGLKDGDVLTGSTLGKILIINDAMQVVDGIAKGSVTCLFLDRGGRPESIRFSLAAQPKKK